MTLHDDDVGDLLRHLDHPLPPLRATDVMKRVSSRRWATVGRAAAVMLVVGLGGVAWAAPGSPVPRLMTRLTSWISRVSRDPMAPTVSPTPVAATPAHKASFGVAVAPGRRLLIGFGTTQRDGGARVTLEDVAEVSVRALAGGAAFTSTDDELRIDNRGSTAAFEIVIPHAAAHVEIRVAGRRVFLKEGDRIVAPHAVLTGTVYQIPLTAPGAGRR